MSEPQGTSPAPGDGAPRVRDRQVVLVSAAVVVAVLGTQALGIVVPGLDDLLGFQPAVIVVLLLVTAAILWASVRSAPRRG